MRPRALNKFALCCLALLVPLLAHGMASPVQVGFPLEGAEGHVPNAGPGLESLARGALGMVTVLLIAVLFSADRRAIDWKTTFIGLGLQALLAVGILQVGAVQWFFEVLGLWLGRRGKASLRGIVQDCQLMMIGPAWLLSALYRRLGIPF